MVKRVGSHILKFVLLGMSKLPLRVLYALSDVLYFAGYYIVGYRRNVVRANLEMCFPEKTPEERKAIEKRFFRHLVEIMAETLKNIGGDENLVRSRIEFTNIELLKDLYAQGKSISLYTGHYGNWEWLTVLPLYVPYRMIAFYQPLSNSMFDKLMKSSREKYGIIAVPSAQAYRSLKKFSDEGVQTLSLVLGDQSPPPNGQWVWIDFLNRQTAFLTGANKIARKLDQVVVYPHFVKVRRGYYKVEMIVIHPGQNESGDHPIIRNYAAQLEKSIRHDPGLWLWSHRRWKLSPGQV